MRRDEPIYKFSTLEIIVNELRIAVSPYQVLASYGIKGPRPLPLVGNYLSVRKV